MRETRNWFVYSDCNYCFNRSLVREIHNTRLTLKYKKNKDIKITFYIYHIYKDHVMYKEK